MRQLYRSSVALLAVTVVVSVGVGTAAAAGAAPASGSTTVGVAPTVPFGAQAAGSAPANEHVAFDVVLRPRDQSALDSFVASVSTPGSPNYHQFVTAAEFADTFGPTASTVSSVRATLESLGLTVDTSIGSVLTVSGSVSKVGGAFKTSFRRYRLASGRVARANVAAPQLPNSIASAVQGVVGLDDLAQFSHPVPMAASAAAVSPNLAGPAACSPIAPGGNGYYVAGQLASYYGLNASYTAGTLGAGVRVAVVELEPFTPSDIAGYQTCYQTTTPVTPISVDGGPSGGQAGEAALDIEDIIGLAPAAAIDVYQGPDASRATDSQVLDIYSAIANHSPLAQVVSTSWGQCESSAGSSFMNSENLLFEQMAAQGQTVIAASGDAGSADCDRVPGISSSALAVDDPASQPFVTGVGGTNLTATTGPETAWNDGIVSTSSGTHVSSGGGGVSSKWPMPSWQTALGTMSGSSGIPCGVTGGSICREVPDVSASADPNNGYPIFFSGGWFGFGGTSAAAPTWAALIALIDSSCGAHKLGLINPALYQLRAAGTSDFHDVITGNNDGAGTNSGSYAALAGYDMATGLGTPQGGALRTDLCPAVAADGAGSMTVDHATVGVSTRTTLHFTYTAPAGHGLTNGELKVTPTGWSTPSTSSGAAGYTTASAGDVTISGGAIDVQGVTTVAGGTVVITYGDTTGGGPGALAPSGAGTSVFNAAQRGTSTGTVTALASSPQVLVGTAADGSGTMSVSPSSAAVTTPTTLSFTYAPPAGTGLTAGAVAITIPSGWTSPQIGSNAGAGFVTSSAGTPTISGGSTIVVDPVTIAIGATLTITFGSVAVHSSAAAITPSSATTSTFNSQQRGTSGGALTSLASSPAVTVGSSGGGGGGSGGAVPSQLNVLRVSGPDRVGTSVAASQTAFPKANSAQAVVLARSDAFADALAGTPLAVSKHGPLVLTSGTALSTAAAAEIQRVLAPGGTVYLLGGTAALSPAVASAVTALGHPIVRVFGADRYATAVQVAAQLGNPNIVFEADGTTFPDALSAGSAAAEAGGVILLTGGRSQSSVTAAYLAAHPSATRYAIGGPAASADPLATAFVGADRFATSVLVAQAFFAAPDAIALASGVTFPDALSGGTVAAMNHGPILLVPSVGALPSTVMSYLETAKETATVAWLFGGTASVSAQVFGEIASALATTP